MHIKAFQKLSLIDFSPHVAAVVFTGGCSMRCPFCYNPDLVLRHREMPDIHEEEIFDYIEGKKNFLDGVCITGGEPCIYPDVVDFAAKLKERGLAVKVNTNGTRPKVLKQLISKKFVDRVAMDVKGTPGLYFRMSGVEVDLSVIRESIALVMESGVDYEFHTTPVRGILDKAELAGVGDMIRGASVACVNDFTPARGLVDPSFEGVKRFTREELADLADTLRPFVREVKIA